MQLKAALDNRLQKTGIVFIAWSTIAAFGAYFCMYAFRKPFNAGIYPGHEIWGMDYKAILIISQAIGYMLSKFIGIKIISELTPRNRKPLLVLLILFAEISLFFFGIVSPPYNAIFLFFNGLPLGMVWGLVFSYLEGRRVTELLGLGLSTSIIIASGIIKTIYFVISGWFPNVPVFWLPFIIGLFFLPFFLLFVWMLQQIPPPDGEDKLHRVERHPMSYADKKKVIKTFKWELVCLVLIYTFLVTLCDFRDNFSVEIWNEIQPGWDKSVFTRTELISGGIVLLVVGTLPVIKNNIKGLQRTMSLVLLGLIICAGSSLLFGFHRISPFWWMLLIGLGLFLAYVPMQVSLFERMIAVFNIKGNAGFFMYVCDAVGYQGIIGIVLLKELFIKDTNWANMMINCCYLLAITCTVLLIIVSVFFKKKTITKI